MKHYRTLTLSALVAFSSLSAWAQTNKIASVAIGTASTAGGTANGVASVTELIGTPLNQPGSVGNNLAGLQYVPGQILHTFRRNHSGWRRQSGHRLHQLRHPHFADRGDDLRRRRLQAHA
jgi:hypothetical protein